MLPKLQVACKGIPSCTKCHMAHSCHGDNIIIDFLRGDVELIKNYGAATDRWDSKQPHLYNGFIGFQ